MNENSYKKHSINNLNDILNEMNSGTCSPERKSMLKSLQKVIKKLKKECIFTFPNISQTLKKCGMSYENIKDFLLEFTVDNELSDIITKRLIKKSNKWEKNILFTYICIDNSTNLVDGLEKFYINNSIKWKKNVDLRNEMQNNINEVEFQKRNHHEILNNNPNISNEMVNHSQAAIEIIQSTSNDVINNIENTSFSDFDENPNDDDDCNFVEDDFFTELFF